MTNIGTLLAFVIVCAGIMVLASAAARSFRAPSAHPGLDPPRPILGILFSAT